MQEIFVGVWGGQIGRARRRHSVTRRNLRNCTIDGVIYSVMFGVGETYLAAFAISLGLGDVVAGLIASVPVAVGAILQLAVPAGVRWLGSQRRWVVLCAIVQATSFVPLIIGALVGRMPAAVLFVMASMYWAAAISAGPAWNTWVGTFIPRRVRAHYFGFRWRVCNMGTVTGLALAGLVLYWFATPIHYQWRQTAGPAVVLSDPAAAQPRFVAPRADLPTVLAFDPGLADSPEVKGLGPQARVETITVAPPGSRALVVGRRVTPGSTVTLTAPGTGGRDSDWPPRAFAVLFLVAALCRYSCLRFLLTTSEPVPIPERARVVPARELFRRAWHGNDGRLLLFMVSMTAAVQIAQPFLNPYMLTEVDLPDLGYSILLGAAFTGKIISPPLFGRFARRFGANRLLWLGGIGLIPLSALWMVSDSFWYLLAAQLLSGVLWAAYELATFLLLFETIHESERTSVLTTFNLCNFTAMLGGSALGGMLLRHLGEDHAAYMTLFAVSFFIRACTLFLLFRVAPFPLTRPVRIATTALAVRPNEGSIDEPVLESIAETGPDGVRPLRPPRAG
jgi:MFS family permease